MLLRRWIPAFMIMAACAAAPACSSSDSAERPHASPDESSLEPQSAGPGSLDRSPLVKGMTPMASGTAAGTGGPTGYADSYQISGDPLTYKGGPLMESGVNVYFIWYGNWTNSTTPAILTDLVKGLGGTPYFNINTTYYDSTGRHPLNAIRYIQSVNDPGSLGTNLHMSDIDTIATSLITKQLPYDPNGLYVVATSANVTITDPAPNFSFCVDNKNTDGGVIKGYCGWHHPRPATGGSVSVVLVPDASTQCPTKCTVITPSPNGNPGADEMASVLVHEISESITDPNGNAWGDDKGNENGDECAGTWGTQQWASPNCNSIPCANLHVGSRDYLVQTEVVNLGSKMQFCAMRFYRNNDIVWRNSTTGDVAVQSGDGSPNPSFAYAATGVPLEWSLVGRGDFDGDGYGDFLWRDTRTGDVAIWLMNGSKSTGAATVYPGLPSVWQTIGTADFDGDGKTDIAWRNNSTGDVVFWFMNGTTIASAPTVAAGLPLAWAGVATGDFNGDGKGDILWRNTSTLDVYMWLMNGTSSIGGGTVAAGLNVNWVTIGTGDFNGDGYTDILWQNRATKDVVIWFQNGVTTTGTQTPKTAFTGYELIGVGDFNGDGYADIMWRNTSTTAIVTWRLTPIGTINSTLQTMTTSNPGLVSNGAFTDRF